MGPSEALAILLVICACGLLMAGYPVALTLGGVSLAFAVAGHFAGYLDVTFLGALPQRIAGIMTSPVLLAIPLFIFMGVMLERSRVAEDLLESLGRLLGPLRGGLGLGVIVVGALLAAAKGVVGATVVTIGLITLPAMLRHGYDPRLAAGLVAATSTLAQIMPPATVLVLLGDQLNTAYQSSQLAKGVFAPDAVTVSDLFAGALVPALTLVVGYAVFVVVLAWLRPLAAPAAAIAPDGVSGWALGRHIGAALAGPILLILIVLGSILIGLATATEAASIGAVGAILLAAQRIKQTPRWPAVLAAAAVAALLLAGASSRAAHQPMNTVLAIGLLGPLVLGIVLALTQLHRAGSLFPTVSKTAQMTSMIFTILIGATMFSLVFRGFGGDALVHEALGRLPGGPFAAVGVVMLAMFLLGFVLDAFEIIFVVVPIVAPPLLQMEGVDPIWLGILMAMNLQTSYMHPPLGPTLFFLRGVAPPEITTRHIYIGAIPFIAIQLVCLAALWFVPELATYLPHVLYPR